jgi:penicillin-binding protein 1C
MKNIKLAGRVAGILILSTIVILIALNFVFPLPSTKAYSVQILSSDKTILHAYLTTDEKWRIETVQEDIPIKLLETFLYKEDKYFYYHPGFNPAAILRAAFRNSIQNKKTSGASTITMQVARLLEPKQRTYWNKISEVFRAIQLELHYSKKEILEMYLNYVPYGSNIEGVGAAALVYFKKPLQRLSPAELAVLTIVPNRPISLRPGKANAYVIKERNLWLQRYYKASLISSEELRDALNENFTAQRNPLPKKIPQLALRLKTQYPNQTTIQSCIQLRTQNVCEEITYQYINRLHSKGIYNASVFIIDNKTQDVITYIGSSDFLDSEHQGQIDGVVAIRSPGSTLKPFVYARAFDKGLLTPHAVIADVPTDFNGYSPDNFDLKFYGKVSVEKALAYSLNIPAVKCLQNVGLEDLINLLKQAQFNTIKRKSSGLGPSLILGGCGVSLEELTAAYTTFVHEGKLFPHNFIKTEKPTGSTPLFSSAASYMIHEILSSTGRPDLPNHYQNTYRAPRIAWKTGTSYGRRDAWSIGYSKNYTVGVWVGNFDGTGIAELTGADIATPLLFQLFNTIDYNASGNWFAQPKSLSFRFVCPETGLPAGELCDHQVMDYFIPNVSASQKCDHLNYHFVSPDESYNYCNRCLPLSGYKKKAYPNLSAELVAFYKKEHLPFLETPKHNPACEFTIQGNAPEIISPIHKKEYLIEKLSPSEIMLKSRCASDIKKVYWYINNKYYKEARNGETLFFTPQEGTTSISCSDDKGNNTSIQIEVVYF